MQCALLLGSWSLSGAEITLAPNGDWKCSCLQQKKAMQSRKAHIQTSNKQQPQYYVFSDSLAIECSF